MRLVLIADTHTYESRLEMPAGDGLIVAGDITNLFGNGWEEQVRAFAEWLKRQHYEFKAVIGGNHDAVIESNEKWAKGQLGEKTYLRDEETSMGHLRVWGAPWTQAVDRLAFNLHPLWIGRKWDLIPEGVDVLITHGPPYGILDETGAGPGGDESLRQAVERIQPRLHVFGHIHEGHGTKRVGKTLFVNASVAGGGDIGYAPRWDPIVIDLEMGGAAKVVDLD